MNFPSNKLRLAKMLKDILDTNMKKRVFLTYSESEKKEVIPEVKCAIKAAKQKYKNKVKGKITEGTSAQLDKTEAPSMWKQLCAQSLNCFYSRFKERLQQPSQSEVMRTAHQLGDDEDVVRAREQLTCALQPPSWRNTL